MKKRLFTLLILATLTLSAFSSAQAQSAADGSGFEITYDETRRRLFSGMVDTAFTERWRLLDTRDGDIPIIRVTRISGQLSPDLRLYDSEGTLVAESLQDAFVDTAELIYAEGLDSTQAPYQIEIVAHDVINEVDNPVEYSLSVALDGRLRQSPDEGLTALPDVGINPPPILAVGESQNVTGLDIPIFGTFNDASATSIVSTQGQIVTLQTTSTISAGVGNITLLDTGIGLTIRNENLAINPERRFFSDEDFTVAYNEVSRNYTFTMSNGMVIITPFAQIESIEVRGGLAAFRITVDNEVKRLVFDNESINVRRSGGDTPNYVIELDGNTITTDLAIWDTLVSFLGQIRVHVGNQSRFISDLTSFNITGIDGSSRQRIVLPVGNNAIDFTVDWSRISDITINGDDLTIATRNGIESTESIAELQSVLIDDGAVRFNRIEGNFRTVYPDGTDISTRATLTEDSDLLPYETGFRTRNYNNLGDDILPTCPCSNDVQSHTPINPANGNFYYHVEDFTTQGQALALNLVRYYNSHDSRYVQGIIADSRLTPRYMLNSEIDYPRFGNGWRHSFQYELDITNEPLGRISFIEPDGTSHYFAPIGNAGDHWSSSTLRSMRIFRVGGAMGTWRAETSNGLRYYFDRVGRLTRISERDQSIILTPAPLAYTNSAESSGVFVVGAYGRRIELYINDNDLITTARNSELRPINYSYSGNALIGVDYEPPTQERSAQYLYSAVGLLASYNDVRSPYTRTGQIDYYPDNRVENIIENPNDVGDLQREYVYIYEDFEPDSTERITNRILEVNGERRVQQWTYNDLWQLIDVQLPKDNWDYQFAYDPNSGQLQSVRVPTDVSFNLTFDARGNLTRFEDPQFTGESAYNLIYEQRGTRSLLTQIRYPNNRSDTFIWSDDPYPLLLAHEQLIAVGAQRITRTRTFQYDDLGRLVMLTEPNNIATIYRYNSVGYVSAILEGINVEAEETPSDITDDQVTSITSLSYDLSGQLQRVVDTRGTAYSIRWTQSGQISSIATSTGETLAYSYDESGRITNINDRGQESIYTYNGLNMLTDYRNAVGSQQTFTYDEAGNLLALVNGLGLTQTFEYDVLDQLTQHRNTNGAVTRYTTELDSTRNAIIHNETDATGRELVRRYDFLGRLTLYSIFTDETDETPFQEFRFEYNSGAGRNLTGIVDTLTGRTINLTYNLGGDLLSIVRGDSETAFNYFSDGRLAQVTSPAESVIGYEYDETGEISRVVLPDGTVWQYVYDGNGNLTQAIDPLELSTIYTFDELNRLESVTDPLGQIESYSYDARGNLATITDAREISTNFTYTPLNQLASITDGARNLTSYEYDALGRLEVINQTDASPPTRLTYDNAGNIIAITEQRQRLLYSYDALGRVTSITDPAGRTTTFNYDTVGALIGRQDALGNTETYTRAVASNFLQSYTDRAGRQYTLLSDNLGRITDIRLNPDSVASSNFEPIDTQIFYDADGYITDIQIGTLNARTSGTGDRLYQFTYSDAGLPIVYVDEMENTWLLTYDDNQRLTEVVNPQDIATQYIYDDVGRVVAVINAVGEDTEYRELYRYDDNGNVVSYEIPDLIRHEYSYNQLNLMSQATLASGTDQTAQYLFDYNAFGRLTRMIDPSGRETSYLYPLSAPDNLATRIITGSEGTRVDTSYDYDTVGNLASIQIAGSEEDINISYDALDRRVRYVNSLDNSWAYTYDDAGNIAQISDPLGSVVSYTYDAYDRVRNITFPSGAEVTLQYGIAGNLSSVISPADGNNVEGVRYQLNEAGLLRSVQVGTSDITFDYDELGNITRRVAPDGVTTTYSYDSLGRLVSTAYSNSDEIITYDYDAFGNRTQIGEIQLRYDVFGRTTSVTDNDQLSYAYSATGNLETRQSDIHGTTTYIHDDLGRVISIAYADQQMSISYDENGRIDSYIRGTLTTQITYDENERITQVGHFNTTDGRPRRIDVFTYNYDAVGNLIKVERLEADGQTTEVSYSYDIDQRLISERWLSNEGETFYAVNYRYDDVGNRIEENRNGRVTTFIYNNQNQLIEEERNLAEGEFLMLPSVIFGILGLAFVARRKRLWVTTPLISGLFVGIAFAQTTPQIRVEYEYDSSGNMTLVRYISEEVYTLDYDYDNENRLVSVQGETITFDDDGEAIGVDIATQYTYDEVSRVVGISTLDGAYELFYDDHTLIAINNGESLERYLTVEGHQLMTITGDDQILWNLNDRQNSTRRYTDMNGTLLDDRMRELEFGAFGTRIFPYSEDLIAPSGARITSPVQFFAGQLYDPSTRLYLMGMRAYDPIVGRFLQPDPIRHDPVGTLYTYARNRPLTYYDPTGMIIEPLSETITIDDIIQHTSPADVIPQPDLSPIPIPSSVHDLQADEFFRALELVRSIQYGVNTPVMQLSPLYDDLYLTELEPIPNRIRDVLRQPLDNMMSIYETGDGWQPNPRPRAQQNNDPFARLDNLILDLAPTVVRPFAFNDTQNVPLSLLPRVSIPTGISQQQVIATRLIQELQPIQPLVGVETDIDALVDFVPIEIEPQVTLPTVDLPSAVIEPAILNDLDDLREQTYAFYSRNWILGNLDCTDCLPPIGFNQ